MENKLVIPNTLELFFDDAKHKYTDNCGNTYTSTTTLLGKYYEKFDAKKMARICELSGRRGNPKYKGKSAKMLEAQWAKTSVDACDYGTDKHGYLENCVKGSTGYRININNVVDKPNKLLLVSNVLTNPGFGYLNLEYFIETKIHILYPSIYEIIVKLVNQGYRIYSEIGVFLPSRLVSGTIDLFFIKGNEFIILDWKTNKDDIRYDAGYFEKDENGETTSTFIQTYKKFYEPLAYMPASTGHKYSMQLSIYAYLCEILGLVCKAIVLCHIRRDMIINPNTNQLVERVEFYPITYYKEESKNIIDHHYHNRELNSQTELNVNPKNNVIKLF